VGEPRIVESGTLDEERAFVAVGSSQVAGRICRGKHLVSVGHFTLDSTRERPKQAVAQGIVK